MAEEDQDQTQPQPEDLANESNTMRNAREAAERNAAAAAKVPNLERENAFLRAIGPKMDTDLGKLLVAGYDGELTTEAIKDRAIAIGLIEDGAPPAAPQADEDVELQQTRAALRQGTVAPQTQEEIDEQAAQARHPTIAGVDEFWDKVKGGLPAEDAAPVFFDDMIGAAMAGDQRALVHQTPVRD